MVAHQISKEVRRNFHLFCDNFPFPVMMVHKYRTILAVNKTAETEGYPTGVRCIEMGKREHHKGCLANQALAELELLGISGLVKIVWNGVICRIRETAFSALGKGLCVGDRVLSCTRQSRSGVQLALPHFT